MTHGDHWAAIHPNVEELTAEIVRLIEQGTLPARQPEPGCDPRGSEVVYRYLLGPDHPLTGTVLLQAGASQDELIIAYPTLLDLARNELEIYHAEPDEAGGNAVLEGFVTTITRDGREVKFFCPSWLACKSVMEAGGRYEFGLGALAYSLDIAERDIEITEGGLFESEKKRRMADEPDFDPSTFTSLTIGMGNLRAFLPRERGDFEFQSVVEEVTPFSGLGTAGLMLTLNLSSEDRQSLMVRVYACEAVLGGLRPEVGDPVRGVGWLQGMPLHKVDAAESWLDSAEAAHGSGGDKFFAMASFVYDHPHLPLAFQVVGAALVGAGWEITSIEQQRFRTWAPAFHAQRRNENFWIFVRTAIKGCFDAPSFVLDRAQTEEYAAGHQARCLWVTITLEPSGSRNYAVTAEGLEEFDGELQVPLEACRPEEFHVLSLAELSKKVPEPVLDEAHAADVFAEGINHGDLAAFSALLVEDLDYVSQTTHVRIRGRQPFLSYLGTHLDHWIKEGKALSATTSQLPSIDGDGRPCAIACDSAGKPVAITVFTGRKGHIAMIETLPPKVLEE